MSDTPVAQATPQPAQPPAPKAGVSWPVIARWTAVTALAGSVLALDVFKVPAPDFLNLIVIPGLSYLGLHTAAKTLT